MFFSSPKKPAVEQLHQFLGAPFYMLHQNELMRPPVPWSQLLQKLVELGCLGGVHSMELRNMEWSIGTIPNMPLK